MRTIVTSLLAVVAAVPLLAQTPPPRRVIPRGALPADGASAAIKVAIEQLTNQKKIYDRDMEVLKHVRVADAALIDPSQPMNALQKAFEEIEKAKSLVPDFVVMDGLTKTSRVLDDARRSPGAADFGRLRAIVAQLAERPAARAVVNNVARLEDDILSWLKVQEAISVHLRVLSEIAGESLRASQE